jgi:ligand-binding sensor domain-containing protein
MSGRGKLMNEVVMAFMPKDLFLFVPATLRKTIPYSICLAIFILCHATARGQLDERRFVRYTIQDGLSDNLVHGLAQDEKGFIWIATENGLNRFDGFEFRKLSRSADDGGPVDEIINLSAKGHQLLLTTRKGVLSLDVRKEKLIRYSLTDAAPAGAFVNEASDALFTKAGDVLMSSLTGFYAFSKNGALNFRYDKYKVKKGNYPASGYGKSLAALPGDLFIHFADDEMFIFDNRLKKYASVDEYRNRLPNLASGNRQLLHLPFAIGPHKMALHKKGTNELFFYDGNTDHLQPCQAPAFFNALVRWHMNWYAIDDTTAIVTSPISGLFFCHFNTLTGSVQVEPTCYLSDYFCTAALKDKEGRLWIGTNKGLLKQDLFEKSVRTLNVRSFLKDSNSQKNNEIAAFYRHHNELYVGTYSLDGMYVFDARDLSFRQKISFARLNPKCNQVWSILPITKDTLWIATQHGLVWLHSGNKHFGYVSLPEAIQQYIGGKPVSIFFKDSHNLLWLQGLWGRGVVQYDLQTRNVRVFKNHDPENDLPVKSANFIIEDAESNIWLAERGLTRWNRQSGRFDTVMESYTGFNRNNFQVLTLTTSHRKEVVFSNRNNGVLFYDPVLKNYRQLTTEQGLPENGILAVLGLNNDRVWIASRNYLSAYDQQTKKLFSYSYTDGIPSDGGLPATLYHDTVAKRIFIGYSSNLIGWVADTVPHTVAAGVPFFIDAISTATGSNIPYPGHELQFPYHENDIRIHVAAINFLDVQNNRFWYRIGGNTSWVALEKQNSIHLNNLAPGSYPVEIKVSSASNRWQQVIRKMTIIIQPPFWQTAWFYLFVALLLSAIIFIAVRYRIRNIRRTAELNNLLAVTEMKALHAQMNPHFIFNSLNSVQELILQNENDKASHYLARFAWLIRMNLDHSQENFITLEQNIQYLHRYLEIEQLRFEDFEYNIFTDNKLDAANILLPPMLLQPLIENAIWHGLKLKRGNKKINIRFLKQYNQLVCEIEDNGIGINQSAQKKQSVTHQSTGIDNIKDRIGLLNSKYHINSRLEIEDRGGLNAADSGTLARLTISLIYE